MNPHIQCQPWWEEVPSIGLGIVAPHYRREDGIIVKFSAGLGHWAGVWPNGDIINNTLAPTPVAAMNQIDDMVPRTDLGEPGGYVQRPVSIAITPHNETIVVTDRGRFYRLRVHTDGRGLHSTFWDELKLPSLPKVSE